METQKTGTVAESRWLKKILFLRNAVKMICVPAEPVACVGSVQENCGRRNRKNDSDILSAPPEFSGGVLFVSEETAA